MHVDEQSLAVGVAALLEARGQREIGALVRRSVVEVAGRAERWTMGARDVAAHRIALVVSAADHVMLSSSTTRLETLRDAFAAAVRTPETELENLYLVLALPPSQLGFHRGYRDAPVRLPEAPATDSVLGGAVALCWAEQDEVSARALERATLEDAIVATGARSVRRFVLRLDAPDFAKAERDPAFGDRLMRAVRSAAVTAADTTTAVFLGVRFVETHSAPGPEALLVQSLERRNVVTVPIARDDERTLLALVYQDKLALLELTKGSPKQWFKKPKSIESDEMEVDRLRLSDRAIESPDAVEAASVEVLRVLSEALGRRS
ncbi:MAG: hypothetical protein IPM54_40670 [Polyangiaceae bacterium]|nr:hypothetical protein [Polyangiaceae bacterium]